MRRILGGAAGLAVVAVLSGWGSPLMVGSGMRTRRRPRRCGRRSGRTRRTRYRLSLGPTLLPLGPVTQGAITVIVAAHGYAAGALARSLHRQITGSRRIGRDRRASRAWVRPTALAATLGLVLSGCAPVTAGAAVDPGPEGQRFLAAATVGTAVPPLRVYVGLDAAPTPAGRVAHAVAELERLGGFRRSTLLVVAPTGSGWVNPAAVASLERLTGGDLATVVVQYAARPSWREYLSGTSPPRRAPPRWSPPCASG